jgi:hypothetical protein
MAQSFAAPPSATGLVDPTSYIPSWENRLVKRGAAERCGLTFGTSSRSIGETPEFFRKSLVLVLVSQFPTSTNHDVRKMRSIKGP